MRLILGRAGTGKNRYVMDEIDGTASEDNRIVLIVPEQSSFTFERKLYFRLGARRSGYVEVRSFSRLSDDILRLCGASAKERVNNAAKAALVRRAASVLGNKLNYYRRNRAGMTFYKLAAEIIGECKNAGITPGRLAELAAAAPSGMMRTKLSELSMIYGGYEELLSGRYEDSSDHIEAAAAVEGGKEVFAGKTVYIDGFTGFTEPEYRLISRAAREAKEVAVTLLGGLGDTGTEFFSGVRASARRLRRIFAKAGGTADITELDDKTGMAPGIAALEEFLANGCPGDTSEGVRIIRADDPYDELEKAAAEIVSLVRDRGYGYSEIAVITRDVEGYRAAVKRTFTDFGVPYFSDWTENAAFSAPAVFIRSALTLLEEFSADTLLALLKTSLTSLSAGDIASFENYVYVWNTDAEALGKPFANPMSGIPDGRGRREEGLRGAESARRTAVEWVSDFINRAKGKTAAAVIKEIYLLMERCGAVAALNERGESEKTAALLEQLYHILGDDVYEPSEIIGMAEAVFAETYNGEIPNTLEQVQVGAADRIRVDNPRAVFVIGLCEGRFPCSEFDFPLLSLAERDYINEHGGNLQKNFDNMRVMENLHLYNALTGAGERLYICFPAGTVAGEPLEPSAVISRYIETFSPEESETAGNKLSFIVNETTAKKAYAESAELRKLIRADGIFDFCDTLDALEEPPEFQIADKALINGILGGEIRLSPSRIESFGRCRFGYFLQYLAGVLPQRPVEISPLQAGNFIHAVMEYVFGKAKGNLVSLSESELGRFCCEAADNYTQNFLKEACESSAYIRYQTGRLKEQTARLASFLRKEQGQSEFAPAAFELPVGEGGVPAYRIVLPDGTETSVSGKIDRIDVAEIDGKRYVRVVDYKTGIKEFSIDDVYYGLNIQMLVYLFSLIEPGAGKFENMLPAGVLYMPSDPPLPELGKKSAAAAYRMDGLVLNDSRVVEAMEKGARGFFIPVKNRGDSPGAAAGKLAGLEEMGAIKRHIDGIIADMAASLKSGDIAARPAVKRDESPCDYCPYTAVCGRDRIHEVREIEKGAGKALLKGGETDD